MRHETYATKFVFFLEWAEKFLSGKLKCIALYILKICSLSIVKLVLDARGCSCEYFHFPQVCYRDCIKCMLRNTSYTTRNLLRVYHLSLPQDIHNIRILWNFHCKQIRLYQSKGR